MALPWPQAQLARQDCESCDRYPCLVGRCAQLSRDPGSNWTKVGPHFLAARGHCRRRGTALPSVYARRECELGPKCTRSRWKSRSPERRSEEHTSELQSRFDLV